MDDARPFLARTSKPPTARALAAALGGVAPLFVELERRTAALARAWNHSKTSGWMLKLHDGKKALCYLVPLAGAFRASLTVRPEERAALARDPALAAVQSALQGAKKYPEGYLLRFDIVDRPSFAPFLALIDRIVAARAA